VGVLGEARCEAGDCCWLLQAPVQEFSSAEVSWRQSDLEGFCGCWTASSSLVSAGGGDDEAAAARGCFPPMVYQRLRFRRSRWMTTAVFQRSLAAIELRSALGVWWTRLLLLRPSSGGAADLQRRVAWWPGVRTFKDHFVFFLSARVLSALSPGQLAFGLLLACGCVCGLCSCI
jgi:hypothetical protein